MPGKGSRGQAGTAEQFHELLRERYREAGIADVTVTLYPAARHEILNETNRDLVTADAWLRTHAAQAGGARQR